MMKDKLTPGDIATITLNPTAEGVSKLVKYAAEKEGEIKLLNQQIQALKRKAEKWDTLGEKIAACYGKENKEGEWEENRDDNIDIGTVGEIAATAFGWL